MFYVSRSKGCRFVVDRQEGEGGCGANCPECVVLTSRLQQSLNVLPQSEVTQQDSNRKKRGRPKGSKTKQDPPDDDQHKKAV